jgi:sulfur carrier protein ThiS
MSSVVTANGKPIAAKLPCTLEEFLVAQKLLPRSVVVEHNDVTSGSKRVKQAL